MGLGMRLMWIISWDWCWRLGSIVWEWGWRSYRTVADQEIFKRGWRTMYRPRRHLSQMHTTNYMLFIRKRVAYWKKIWANRRRPLNSPQSSALSFNPPLMSLCLASMPLSRAFVSARSTGTHWSCAWSSTFRWRKSWWKSWLRARRWKSVMRRSGTRSSRESARSAWLSVSTTSRPRHQEVHAVRKQDQGPSRRRCAL